MINVCPHIVAIGESTVVRVIACEIEESSCSSEAGRAPQSKKKGRVK